MRRVLPGPVWAFQTKPNFVSKNGLFHAWFSRQNKHRRVSRRFSISAPFWSKFTQFLLGLMVRDAEQCVRVDASEQLPTEGQGFQIHVTHPTLRPTRSQRPNDAHLYRGNEPLRFVVQRRSQELACDSVYFLFTFCFQFSASVRPSNQGYHQFRGTHGQYDDTRK